MTLNNRLLFGGLTLLTLFACGNNNLEKERELFINSQAVRDWNSKVIKHNDSVVSALEYLNKNKSVHYSPKHFKYIEDDLIQSDPIHYKHALFAYELGIRHGNTLDDGTSGFSLIKERSELYYFSYSVVLSSDTSRENFNKKCIDGKIGFCIHNEFKGLLFIYGFHVIEEEQN
ncbi:hypothetical protein N474_25170 [Pseudoalteromonas luteoviolacea CPMOR-2]|uniref:hypothetical protein n=1 Tax=Pseudoalteromonas luteoviolacea TaxID=43657 RepID=UPI0007B06FA9|nr:hypothetical protein [Pseudoalteromonas luteoviolacea]KZN48917.1 hypothetical protein N474_25170 [Pseudoalteromonas luteoviolacea CPMOR-2]